MLNKILAISVAGIRVAMLAVGLSALYAWPVQLLYNYWVTSAGGVAVITFKQA